MEPNSARFKPRPPHFQLPDEFSSRSPRNPKIKSTRIPIRPPNVDHLNRSRKFPTSRYPKSPPKQRITLSPVIPNGPITPKEAIQTYSSFLTEFELNEINNFPEIYFLGRKGKKIIPDPNDVHNYGLDDETNNYKLIAGDHLAYRFEIQDLFGAGAFGQVARCYDHKKKQVVAIKVIVNTVQMHEQGNIEATILARLNANECPNVVRAYDYFVFRSHICLSFEVLGMNLYELSEANEYRPLSMKHVRTYAKQIFTGLAAIHSLSIIHCDMKPENVLLVPGSRNLVKILDFGSSCFCGHQKYEYIQSRFYRAPEVLIGIDYGPPMDIWSTALILIELLIGTPLFPGEDENEQLWMISEVLGYPPLEMIENGRRSGEFFDQNYQLMPGNGIRRIPGSKNLAEEINSKDPYLLDFLKRCLTWKPSERMTAAQALRHPWITMKEITIPSKVARILPEITTSTRLLEPPV